MFSGGGIDTLKAQALLHQKRKACGYDIEQSRRVRVTLPCGEFLVWANQYRQDKCYAYLPEKINATKKEQYPLLMDKRLYPKERVLFADFDTLPGRYSSWDELRETLRFDYELPGYGRILSTPSGKVKVMFIISDKGITPLNALKKILKPEHHFFDHTPVSMTRCYVTNPKEFTHLSKLKVLFSDSPLNFKVSGREVNTLVSFSKDTKIKYKFTQCLPAFSSTFTHKKKDREEFLRVLIAMPPLATRGYDISTKYFGERLGVAWSTVADYLYDLQKLGFLKCTDRRYCPGRKARRYMATGELLKFLKQTYIKREAATLAVPETLKVSDGEWNSYVYWLRLQFGKDEEGFRDYVQRIPGVKNKDRRKKIEAANKSYKKYYENKNNS